VCGALFWTDMDEICEQGCELESCGPEGFAELSCTDVSQEQGVGVCGVFELVGSSPTGMPLEAVCNESSWTFSGYCCPELFGGDELGYGPGGATTCAGVDLATLDSPESYDELLEAGVGVCIGNSSGQWWCGVPCAMTDPCDLVHTCVEVEDGIGACMEL
jgi:hypothetical protein